MKPEPNIRKSYDTMKLAHTYLERGHKLRQRNQEEIQVEEELELLVEHDGQEREGIVLLVPNGIWRESTLQLVWGSKWYCSRLILRRPLRQQRRWPVSGQYMRRTGLGHILSKPIIVFTILFPVSKQSSFFILIRIPLRSLSLAPRTLSRRSSSSGYYAYRHVEVAVKWSIAGSRLS
jgi:hypothetical protein